jgi:putative transposase
MTQLTEKQRELVSAIASDCESPGEVSAMLKQLFAGTLEAMLEAEMNEHLGYTKNSADGDNTGNSRNGYGKKNIRSEWGEAEIAVPRDRNGEFEPKAVVKRQTRTDDIESRILAMYAKGMSVRDIEDHLRDIYGVEASPALISGITDKIMPAVKEWQSRPLDELYPVVFFDGVWFKVRQDSKVIKKCAYSVLGVNSDGHKEILGIWLSESESASFWTSVFNELKNRGIRDILIACHDNLAGFVGALETVFPKTENQLCVIHQIRNSTKHVAYKDLKAVMSDLKKVYGAPSEDAALAALDEFSEKWSGRYPQIVKSWEDNWDDLATFFKYPEEARRLIYTTNAVEGFHRMLRKFTKEFCANQAKFTNQDAVSDRRRAPQVDLSVGSGDFKKMVSSRAGLGNDNRAVHGVFQRTFRSAKIGVARAPGALPPNPRGLPAQLFGSKKTAEVVRRLPYKTASVGALLSVALFMPR